MDGLFTFLIVTLLIAWLVLFVYFEHWDSARIVYKPQALLAFQIGRDFMKEILTYQVTVAAPVDPDVVSRQLSVTVDGVAEGTRTFDGGATDLGAIEVVQNSNVILTLVDVDDAGNYSEPAVIDFVAADTIRPQMPGAFNVVLVSERAVEEVPPTESSTTPDQV